jgi:hypothetical protein
MTLLAMSSFYFMVTCDIQLKSAQSMTFSDDYDEALEFKSDLETLKIRVRQKGRVELLPQHSSHLSLDQRSN